MGNYLKIAGATTLLMFGFLLSFADIGTAHAQYGGTQFGAQSNTVVMSDAERRARLEMLIDQLVSILKQWYPQINWDSVRGRGDRQSAESLIESTEKFINDVRDEIQEAIDDDEDTDAAEALYHQAVERIEEAANAFDDADYSDAKDMAQEARELAQDARDALTGDDDDDDDDDNDADEGDAEEAIDAAQAAIQDAEEEVDDAEDDDEEVSESRDLLEEANDALDDAEEAFDDEDWNEAEERANDARELADDAVDAIGDESDDDDDDDDLDTELGDAEAESPIGGDEARARFEIPVTLRAFNGDFYIKKSAARGSSVSTSAGVTYVVEDSSGDTYTGGTATAVLESDDENDDTSGYFRLNEDEEREFTVEVSLDNDGATAGYYRVRIVGFAFDDDTSSGGEETLSGGFSNYRTPTVFVDDNDAPN